MGLDWDLPPPPNILLWAAVVTFFWSVLTYFWGLWHRRVDRERSIRDDFWYRTILVPICWQPVVDLISKYAVQVQGLAEDSTLAVALPKLRELTLEFTIDKNRVVSRFVVLRAFGQDVDLRVGEILDSIEDEVVEYSASIAEKGSEPPGRAMDFVESVLWSKLADICESMIKLHPRI